jgi:O-antigen/teichoic acid export membrane protein
VLVAVAVTPALVRLLGDDRLGVLGIVWAVLGYLGIFELGIGRALTRSVARSLAGTPGGGAEQVWPGLAALGCLGIGVGAAVAAAAPWLAQDVLRVPGEYQSEATRAFYGVAATVPFVLLASGLRGILEAYGEFRALSFVRSAAGSLMFLGPWLVCRHGPDLGAVVLVLWCTRAATCAVLIRLCWTRTAELRQPWRWRAGELRRMLGYGGWITVSQLAGSAMGLADRLLLGALSSARAVAYYATPHEILSRGTILSSSVATALCPDFARAAEHPARAAALFTHAGRWLLWVLAPSCLLLAAAAPELAGWWLGPRFAAHAVPLLPWMIAGTLLGSFVLIPVSLLQGRGQPAPFARFQLLELLAAAGVLTAAIPRAGVRAAAVALAARAAAETAVATALACRELPAVRPMAIRLAALFLLCAAGVTGLGVFATLAERLAAAGLLSVLLPCAGERFLFRGLAESVCVRPAGGPSEAGA